MLPEGKEPGAPPESQLIKKEPEEPLSVGVSQDVDSEEKAPFLPGEGAGAVERALRAGVWQ